VLSDAKKLLGSVLYRMSQSPPQASPADLSPALELCAESLTQFSRSMSNRAEIARAAEFPIAAQGAVALFHAAADQFDRSAAQARAAASNANAASRALGSDRKTGDSPGSQGAVLRSAGQALQGSEGFTDMAFIGETLFLAGNDLRENRPGPAADRLKALGLQLIHLPSDVREGR
jgi:hypothetical protein